LNISVFNLQASDINIENLWVERKSAQAGWSSAVGLLAVYRLEPSEKEIHLNNERSELSKLAPTSDIAFHDQPAGALFVGIHGFSCRRQIGIAGWKIK
jgi:hypothetical protein